jgi:flagellar hook-length control protein FliK
MPQVVALQISPQLEVITAGVSTASDDSLRAYAAAQGFDAVALQRMFGSGASASGVDPVASGSAAVSPGGNVALAAGTSLGFGVTTGQMPVAPSDAAVDPAMAPSTSATPGPVSPHLKTIDGQISPTVVKNQDSLAVALERFNADGGRMATRRSELGASPIALDGSRLAGAAVALAAGAGASAAAATPAGASTSAWLALQARQVSDSWVGARVVDSSGVGALTAPLTPALSSVGAAEGAAMPTALSVHLADAPASGSRPEAVPRPVDAQPLDLRDHLENTHEALSKRLGEALATRLLAQVDKGDWQIRLTVTPQHLGPIDIDLQVKGQRLEAQFQVAHGQTQAMIQDSLPRLREAVSASGMDLASVWVSGGWNERNRGNPTPGQPDDPVPLALNEGGGEQAVGGAPPRDPRGLGGVLRPGAVDILI